MGVRVYRTFVGDFETTVYENQASTEVWSSAVVELGTEEVFIHHNKLTIGACCLSEFKKTFDSKEYDFFFPNVYDIQIDETKHSYKTAGKWIHKTYRGVGVIL